MKYRQIHLGAWPIVLIVVLGVGCASIQAVEDTTSMLPIRASCDKEAQQLGEMVAVYSAPQSSLAPVAKLDQGRFVYRCEQRGEWLGVMFPAAGEKVDCSERQPERACSLGWIRSNVQMQIFG